MPGVAAGVLRDGEVETCADGVLQLGSDVPVRPETPFRVASISKPFTASLAVSSLPLDEPLERWLSHTAGFRCESETPLPAGAEGLFSYSNAGYWAAGREVARVLGAPFEQAMRDRILEPLGLAATGYDDPGAVAARGHLQEGETGHRAVPGDVYPVERRPSGRALVDRRRPARLCGAPARRARPARGRDTGGDARAAVAGARCRLRARLVGPRCRRPRGARPRGIRRRLPVAAAARSGGRLRARGADEQLARQRARPARGRAAGAGAAGPGRSRRGQTPGRGSAGRGRTVRPRRAPRRWWSRSTTRSSSRRSTSIP